MSADEPPVDLDELAARLREWYDHAKEVNAGASHLLPALTPALLQSRRRLTWNAACSALEALEARGDLERVPGPPLAWRPAPAPQKPGKGYALPLSAKEHGALLRALDSYLYTQRHTGDVEDKDRPTLRAIRSRLRETT